MSASFSFSIDELAAIAVSLEDEKKHKRRRWSVHPAWLTKEKEGEFKIYKELVDYDETFHAYFRMSNCHITHHLSIRVASQKLTVFKQFLFA